MYIGASMKIVSMFDVCDTYLYLKNLLSILIVTNRYENPRLISSVSKSCITAMWGLFLLKGKFYEKASETEAQRDLPRILLNTLKHCV